MATFIFAGGGTGGHIFPGLAIASQLRAMDPAARVLFLCSDRAIDRKILAPSGEAFEASPAKPFGLSPRILMRFLRSWGPAVAQARRLVRSESSRGEHVELVAMGGFVAAPAVQAARREGTPITLVNLDEVPGKANTWIAKRAGRVLAAAGGAGRPGWESIAPIVRPSAVASAPPADCRVAMGLDPACPTLLVTGGSQGAGSINALMIEMVRQGPGALKGWQVLHQSGEKGEAEVQAAYDRAGIPARVNPFLAAMGVAWGSADLALARCGAGTVAEVWANAIPTIFLPYPYHKDEHQRRNAQPLVSAGGALLVRDHIEAPANRDEAGKELTSLLEDAPRREAMRRALLGLGPADGARVVATRLLGR